MRETITISLPRAVRRELNKVAKDEGVSRSDVLRQSLEDFLFVRRFRRLRQRMMAAAQAQGIFYRRGRVQPRLVKLLLDTNVLVAALIARGTCSDLLEHCIRHHVVMSSQPLLDELRELLSRKFRQRGGDVRATVRLFEETFVLVTSLPLEAARLSRR
jgi:metal-responsive CopG/Arc/MetJ family transcriptional regulator